MNVNHARMRLLAGRMIQRINIEVDVPATGVAGYVTLGRVLNLPVPSGRFAVLCAAKVVIDNKSSGRAAILAGEHPFEVTLGSPSDDDTKPSRPGVLAWGNNGLVSLAYLLSIPCYIPYGFAEMQCDLDAFHILSKDLNGDTKLTIVVTADEGTVGTIGHVMLEIAYMTPQQALITVLLGEVGKDIARADGNGKVDESGNLLPMLVPKPMIGIPLPIQGAAPITGGAPTVVVSQNTPPPPPVPVVRDTLSNVLLPTSGAVGSVTSSGSTVTQDQQTLGNATSIGLAVATGGISLLVGAIAKAFGF